MTQEEMSRKIISKLRSEHYHYNFEVSENMITVTSSSYPRKAVPEHVVDKAWRDFREMLSKLQGYDLIVKSDNCIFPNISKPEWKISGIWKRIG